MTYNTEDHHNLGSESCHTKCKPIHTDGNQYASQERNRRTNCHRTESPRHPIEDQNLAIGENSKHFVQMSAIIIATVNLPDRRSDATNNAREDPSSIPDTRKSQPRTRARKRA
jgi:hypothetical protein